MVAFVADYQAQHDVAAVKWYQIQENVFCRWVNRELSTRGRDWNYLLVLLVILLRHEN